MNLPAQQISRPVSKEPAPKNWSLLLEEVEHIQRPETRLTGEDFLFAMTSLKKLKEGWSEKINGEKADFAEKLAVVLGKKGLAIDARWADELNDILNGTDVIMVVDSPLHPGIDSDAGATSLVGVDITTSLSRIEIKLEKTFQRATKEPQNGERDYVYVPDDWLDDPDLMESFKDHIPGKKDVSDRVFRVPTVGIIPTETYRTPLDELEVIQLRDLLGLQLALQCRDFGFQCAQQLALRLGEEPALFPDMQALEDWFLPHLEQNLNPGNKRRARMIMGYLDGYREFTIPLLRKNNPLHVLYGDILARPFAEAPEFWRELVKPYNRKPLENMALSTLVVARITSEVCARTNPLATTSAPKQ